MWWATDDDDYVKDGGDEPKEEAAKYKTSADRQKGKYAEKMDGFKVGE